MLVDGLGGLLVSGVSSIRGFLLPLLSRKLNQPIHEPYRLRHTYQEHLSRLEERTLRMPSLKKVGVAKFQAIGQLEFFLVKQYVDILQASSLTSIAMADLRIDTRQCGEYSFRPIH